VAEDKPSVEKAVELFVYAPVGMACYMRDMLPSMMGVFVARGRREVQSHRVPSPPPPPPAPDDVRRRIDESVGFAKVVAGGGIGVARDVAGTGLGVARDVAGTTLGALLARRAAEAGPAAAAPDVAAPDAAAPGAAGAPPTTDARTAKPKAPSAKEPPSKEPASTHEPAPAVDTLAIPDYDELSASQVVERLEGLDEDSLDAIRRYEAAHRGRNTILGKIARLT